MDELACGLEMVECWLMEKKNFFPGKKFFFDNLSLAARLARFSLFRPPRRAHGLKISGLSDVKKKLFGPRKVFSGAPKSFFPGPQKKTFRGPKSFFFDIRL